ncbi:uncharacterized protein LOC143040308 [Oratosquilla oratoria]|uniref:uncharacterized protein LOC143040308 n=1 Tax=Oratosquilla oratoria TaxID=337810 RepID=UPI003F7689A0
MVFGEERWQHRAVAARVPHVLERPRSQSWNTEHAKADKGTQTPPPTRDSRSSSIGGVKGMISRIRHHHHHHHHESGQSTPESRSRGDSGASATIAATSGTTSAANSGTTSGATSSSKHGHNLKRHHSEPGLQVIGYRI